MGDARGTQTTRYDAVPIARGTQGTHGSELIPPLYVKAVHRPLDFSYRKEQRSMRPLRPLAVLARIVERAMRPPMRPPLRPLPPGHLAEVLLRRVPQRQSSPTAPVLPRRLELVASVEERVAQPAV